MTLGFLFTFVFMISCAKSLSDSELGSVSKSSSNAISYSASRVNLAKRQCSGNYTPYSKLLTPNDGLFLEGATNSSTTELRRALSNVPESFQKLFYDIGGRIYVTSKSRDICSKLGVQSHVSPLTCSYTGKNGAYYLVLNSNPVHITDSTLEGFGYVLAQVLRNLSVMNGKLVKNKQSPFNQALKGLSANFINEIRTNPRHSLAAYDAKLPGLVAKDSQLRSCDIGDSALQRSFDSAAFALHFRAAYCSAESNALDKAFLAKSKNYYDNFMYPFVAAIIEGRRLNFTTPPSCGALQYNGASGFLGNLLDALAGFTESSNTGCSLFGCGSGGGGLLNANFDDSSSDLFKPFSNSGNDTVWNGKDDDSYTDSILSNTGLSDNGTGFSMSNSLSSIVGGNDSDDDSGSEPLGSFASSCIDTVYKGDELQMKCGDGKGNYYSTSIAKDQIDKCTNNGDKIENINGVLKCGDYESYKGKATTVSDSKYPWCSSAIETSNGWGWENNKSCRANPKDSVKNWKTNNGSNHSSSEKCEDPDGDGWGWDGSKSCKM